MPPLAFFVVLLLALTACGRCGQAERPAAPRPIATVNGEPVTADALRRELAADRGGSFEAGAPGSAALKRRVLDGTIDRMLLLQEARARSIAADKDQVERSLLRLRADYPGTHFDDLLAQEKLSAAELRIRLREQLTLEQLLAKEVFPGIQVTEADAQRWYDEHLSEFEEPERVRARQVVVRTREEAVRLREELRRRPSSFAEVARRASIAPEGRSGGDLGYFGRGSGMPEVFDVCFKLPLLVLSDVTPSPYGFHVFQVTERKPAGRRSFADAKAGIHENLLRERRAEAQEKYLRSLRQRAQIEVDDQQLDALTP